MGRGRWIAPGCPAMERYLKNRHRNGAIPSPVAPSETFHVLRSTGCDSLVRILLPTQCVAGVAPAVPPVGP